MVCGMLVSRWSYMGELNTGVSPCHVGSSGGGLGFVCGTERELGGGDLEYVHAPPGQACCS